MQTTPDKEPRQPLEQLLQRKDIWRGYARHYVSAAVDTGFSPLNEGLLNGGWPLSALIEVCQQGFQGEWQLFTPALRHHNKGLLVLLNPPAEPFSQAMIQAGINLEQLVIINAPEKNHFLACFSELARTGECSTVLAWQPRAHLTYTELRKCLLASSEGKGLYVLFRPAAVQQQSSPASLRLFNKLIPRGLEVTIFKQKGLLPRHQIEPLTLPLPDSWKTCQPHQRLDQVPSGKVVSPRASVTPFRGKP
jgi:SOS-response cell division inhibitor, blocks FtsZ ring formation